MERKAVKVKTASRMRRSALVLAFILMWGGGAMARPADLAAYPHVKHLIPGEGSDRALGAFLVDGELWAATHEDFANMRVVDETDTEVPFLIRARGKAGEDGSTATFEIVDFAVHEDGTQTVIEFDAHRQATVGIRILTSAENFSRPVLVEGKSGVGHTGFREIFRGTCSNIAAGDVQRDGRTLHFAQPSRCSEWRVTIDNHDNPAMTITGIMLDERVHEAVFINTQPGSCRVFYGGDESKKPRYDMAAILRTSGNAPFALFRLGAEQENEANGRWWSLRVGGKVVLLVGILAMVAVLAWGVSTAARKVDAVT